MLEGGEYTTLAELADTEGIRQSYVCRVLRLTLLAPDIVDNILAGRPTVGLALFLKPFPVEWGKQREQFNLAASQPEVSVASCPDVPLQAAPA